MYNANTRSIANTAILIFLLEILSPNGETLSIFVLFSHRTKCSIAQNTVTVYVYPVQYFSETISIPSVILRKGRPHGCGKILLPLQRIDYLSWIKNFCIFLRIKSLRNLRQKFFIQTFSQILGSRASKNI